MKLKSGDIVKALASSGSSEKDYQIDKIYTVTNVAMGYAWTVDENGRTNAWEFDKFELINRNKTIYQEYKENPKLDSNKVTTGLRYNQNKLRWRNFPMFLMKPLVEVGAYGESKYDTYNFLKGLSVSDTLDSLKRHLEQFESPYEPDEDAESKVNHLAHVAWNALIALHNLKTRTDMDDRYKLPETTELSPEEHQRRGR